MNSNTRILLADAHALVRAGLRMLIDTQEDMMIVGEVGDVRELGDAVTRNDADIIIVDAALPPSGALAAIGEIREAKESARVVVLAEVVDHIIRREAIESGAKGVVSKRAAPDEVMGALRAVARGETYLPEQTEEVAANGDRASGPLAILSPRELEVMRLVALGHTNAEAAEMLEVSIKTVEGYRSRVMRKLGLRTRAGLVSTALRTGLLEDAARA